MFRFTIVTLGIAASSLIGATMLAADAKPVERPNIVFILCDDLGYGDVGAFGQKRIRTPNIDRLAKEGMRLTRHYSGNAVCAPSRSVLMTGLHPGHTPIRDNRQASDFDPKYREGQTPLPAGTITLPKLLQAHGYVTGGFGKWGLGPVGSSGEPAKMGIDRFFGFNCQGVAHNHYPKSLWDNDRPFPLANKDFSPRQKLPADADPHKPESYAGYRGTQYAADVITDQALAFLKDNRERPFLLYFPTTIPHLALQVPEDSLKEYAGTFPETPYRGDKGYLPIREPRAAYAAMVTRMDREVGRLMAAVRELGLDDRTLFVFTSDNGPLDNQWGGTDDVFFNSGGGLRGHKGSLYEGGFRVPTIVRWPGRVPAGSHSDRVSGFEDWLPTLLELCGAADKVPPRLDGISMADTLRGKPQAERPFLYREFPSYGGYVSLHHGKWKLLKKAINPNAKMKREPGPWELYDLGADPQEKNNLAAANADVVATMQSVIAREHEPTQLFPMPFLDELKRSRAKR